MMKGYPTTYLGLFAAQGPGPGIHGVEIPIIQRDFAQGRSDDQATMIRDRFLDALVDAVLGNEPITLDFIYGDVRDGVLRPLDGQQRLTTLFLLHWYVACRAEKLDPDAAWLRFSYATRPSARDFTRSLATKAYLGGDQAPSSWITDQPWYVHPWRHDPTIASMLVMLDAIHDRFASQTVPFEELWRRLAAHRTGGEAAPIDFLFLPVMDLERGEDLYITMNSRGKPLSAFEVFKADFERVMREADPGRYAQLVASFDGAWTDLLWRYDRAHGGDRTVDDEFLRYLTFIVEICEWRDGNPDRRWRDKSANRLHPLEARARLAFSTSTHAQRNRDFLFHAFDTWGGVDPASELNTLFALAGEDAGDRLPLFSSTTDLFGACVTGYGSNMSVQETLLLFAVLLSRQSATSIGRTDVLRRLRTLRNVSAAFLDRERSMSDFIASAERLMLDGDVQSLSGFREYWSADEALKWQFVDANPDAATALYRLEDNPLLRGRVGAFDLDATSLAARERSFAGVSATALRDSLCAALLTKGDYSRNVKWGGQVRQLGSARNDDSWMDLLTTGSRSALVTIRRPLMALLDDITHRRTNDEDDAERALSAIAAEWIRHAEGSKQFDWRYYLVRYPGGRSSVGTGLFHNVNYAATEGGFTYRKIHILNGGSYQSYYSDAILRAAWVEGRLDDVADEPRWFQRQDAGMRLRQSGIEIRNVEDGFIVDLPEGHDEALSVAVRAVTDPFDGNPFGIPIDQDDEGPRATDLEDRVQACVRLTRALVAAGL